MKIKILLSALVIMLLSGQQIFAQTGWIQKSLPSGNNIISVKFYNQNTGYAAGWGGTVLKSTNSGETWFSIFSGNSTGFQCIYPVSSNIVYLCGQGGTILKSTNGGNSWIQQFSVATDILLLMSFINSDYGFVVGYDGVILRTTNGGLNWVQQSSGVYSNLTGVFFTDTNNGWITGDNGVILKTTNSGLNWIKMNTFFTNNLGKPFFINSSTGWIPGTNGLIIKTNNAGATWEIQNSGVNSYLIASWFVSPTKGWVSGVNGKILYTNNGGNSWMTQNTGNYNELHYISFVNENTGWSCGYNGTLLKTINGGLSAPASPNLIYPSNASNISTIRPVFDWDSNSVATHYHIQISPVSNFSYLTDSLTLTNSFYHIPNGKLNVNATYFWRVKAKNSNGYGEWSSIWYFSVTNTGINQISSSVPEKFIIHQNYPNPFNPSTNIKFEIPKSSKVKLAIYDLMGREIALLFNGNLSAGIYAYSWTATNLSSGIYIAKLITDDFTGYTKLTLLK